MERREVAVAIKCIEVGTEDRILPDAFGRLAGARFLRYRLEGNDAETVLHRFERLVIEERADGLLTVGDVTVHFIGCVSFSHKGDTDAAGGVSSLMQYVVWGDIALSCLTDQNVCRHNGMSH